ncbi:hypothetical protein [Myxococcus sp. RHSTA-1-4]|uniref:hypothetical protein n=1 Tax=Myxococcus sp. RHSTA-1-4 TaxID=2874601 RepID=UPI001CBE37BC|nr:hypothetical protein [Myxococcus sp. RHSTA-1-4]MBZ4418971.1 hypothetical protein [Myxococcus sp. RHSTA-1-4]
MHLKMMSRLLAAALLSVTAGCQGNETESPGHENAAAQESSATQCVQQFEGITNCALGNAKLTPTERGLQVDGLTDATRDGVSDSFANATRWTQRVGINFGTEQAGLSLAARSGTQVVSTFRLTPGADGTSARIQPGFTGSPGGSAYRVNVYQDGVFQGGGSHSPSTEFIILDWRTLRWLLAVLAFDDRYDIIIWKSGMASAPSTKSIPGACVWRLRDEQGSFSVRLGDGQVLTGNAIEIVEEIASGHYPYTGFTGMDVTASASEFNILSESVIPAK